MPKSEKAKHHNIHYFYYTYYSYVNYIADPLDNNTVLAN